MTARYQAASTADTSTGCNTTELAKILAKNGQLLLPMLDLIENAPSTIISSMS